jgi:hypothetical protein
MSNSDSESLIADEQDFLSNQYIFISPYKNAVPSYDGSHLISSDGAICLACGVDPCNGKSGEVQESVKKFLIKKRNDGGHPSRSRSSNTNQNFSSG